MQQPNQYFYQYSPVDQVRGMSRETFVEVTANIESQEFRRRQLMQSGQAPENPRAATTDDVKVCQKLFFIS